MARLRCMRDYANYDAGDEYLVDDESEVARLIATGCFESMPPTANDAPTKPSANPSGRTRR